MSWTKDPVTNAEWQAVIDRDKQCIAPLLDPDAGPCRDRWGRVVPATSLRAATVDHVPPYPGAPRISTRRWMARICWGHGVHGHWETAHRDAERAHLEQSYPEPEAT